MSYRFNRSTWLVPLSLFIVSVTFVDVPFAQSGLMNVTSMTPATGMPGTVITLRGVNFGDTQGAKLVGMNLGRVNLMEVRYWSNTKIQAVVPNLPAGEYTVVVYYDNTYRTYAPWTGSPRFHIIPREVPPHDPRPVTPPITPPRSAPITCAPVSSTNMLLNPSFDAVGPRGAFTTTTTTGGAGEAAALHWLRRGNRPEPRRFLRMGLRCKRQDTGRGRQWRSHPACRVQHDHWPMGTHQRLQSRLARKYDPLLFSDRRCRILR